MSLKAIALVAGTILLALWITHAYPRKVILEVQFPTLTPLKK